MNETSKNDSSKLASQITGNWGDNSKEEFRSHSDEARGVFNRDCSLETGPKQS